MAKVSDSVYARHSHDQDHSQANGAQKQHWMYVVSMLHTFIKGGVMFGVAVVWATLRGWRMSKPAARVGGLVDSQTNNWVSSAPPRMYV